MKTENDPELVSTIIMLKRHGKKSVEILHWLAERKLTTIDMMSHFREAFGLAFGDVSCIGGWFPDGTGELDDNSINSLLDSSIADSDFYKKG